MEMYRFRDLERERERDRERERERDLTDPRFYVDLQICLT